VRKVVQSQAGSRATCGYTAIFLFFALYLVSDVPAAFNGIAFA
jgi:hypothetical protein